jgi:F-type H+-transporting ATPase subunit b
VEFVSDITGVLVLAATEGEESGGSFLVTPGLGLMIWTVAAFLFTMFVLSKAAFPKIREMLEERAAKINSDLDAAAKQREEADGLLEEYRARLKEAREQADDIVARAKKTGESAKSDSIEEGRAKREELVAAAKKDIEAETRRSLEQIRKEIADLTVLATERVTRKSLTDDDQKRLVEEALGEVDFSALSGGAKPAGSES